jgi:hypothetical protein
MLIRTMIAAPVPDSDRYILLGRAAHGSLVTDGALAKADLQLDLAASGATVGHPPPVVARGIPQPKKRENRHDYQLPPSHAGCDGRPGGARRRGKGHLVRCVLFARVRAYSRTSNDLGRCLAAYPDRRCGCLDPRGRSSEVHEYLEWRCSRTRRTRPTPIGCLLRATRGCAAPHAPGAAATAWPRRAP